MVILFVVVNTNEFFAKVYLFDRLQRCLEYDSVFSFNLKLILGRFTDRFIRNEVEVVVLYFFAAT